MATEIKKEIQLEIAHVLFVDTVGYSKLSLNAAARSDRRAQRNCSRVGAVSEERGRKRSVEARDGGWYGVGISGQPAGAGPLRISATHFSALTSSPACAVSQFGSENEMMVSWAR